MLILAILGLGLVAGWVAGALLGRRLTWGSILVLGLAGSFIGGLLVSLLAGDGLRLRPSGIIGSIAGSIILLAVVGPLFARSHPRPSSRRTR